MTLAVFGLVALGPATSAQAPDYKAGRAVDEVWRPSVPPKGGVSWKVLESTGETTRTDAQGYIVPKPKFPPQVRALAGTRLQCLPEALGQGLGHTRCSRPNLLRAP